MSDSREQFEEQDYSFISKYKNPQDMSTRHVKEKIHTERRYATCPQSMSKKKKREKDSPHPWKIKKRDGSCKGVHPPSIKKIPTHLHILIRLYNLFLLGPCF